MAITLRSLSYPMTPPPLSIDKAKAESPAETLSVVFEHWARNHRHMGDGKRDVKKTAGEYQTTIVRFVELLGDSTL